MDGFDAELRSTNDRRALSVYQNLQEHDSLIQWPGMPNANSICIIVGARSCKIAMRIWLSSVRHWSGQGWTSGIQRTGRKREWWYANNSIDSGKESPARLLIQA